MTEELKKRRLIMLAAVAIAALGAVGSAVAAFLFDQNWGVPAFLACLVAGFIAQLWFIMGLRKKGQP